MEQGFKCRICNRAINETAHVDHDHRCCPGGKYCDRCIRGLLCPSCNTSLGKFGDDLAGVLQALLYLLDWEVKWQAQQAE